MSEIKDEMIYFGDAVKSLGEGKVGGYLCRYSTPVDPDLEGDFFSKDTDLGVSDGNKLPVYYQHGMDGHFKNARIGSAIVKFDDIGLWLEAQLEMRDDYEKYLFELASQGKLGWSSGAAGHLVDREQIGKSYHIKSWPIAEASLTPTPAEPRNSAVSLKSLLEIPATETESKAEAEVSAQSEGDNAAKQTIQQKESKMEMTDEIKAFVLDEAQKAANLAVEEYKKAQPAVDASGISVTKDEADRPFKSLAEQCAAVKTAKLSDGRKTDPRLDRLAAKANGNTENVPSEGGYLLDPTLAAEFLKPIHEDGVFTSQVRRLPVGNNSNYGWINGVDETSRVAGSRWGGVQGYRVAEAGSITASKPKFRRINWELKKYAVLMYATDELLADSSQFNAVANQSAMEELKFMANDDVLNGTGLGGPLGIMNCGSRVAIQRLDSTKVQHDDILRMWQRLFPAFRSNSAWFINSDVEPQLDALYFSGTTSVMSPYVTYTPEGVMRIKGRPVYVTEFNPSLNSAGDILLADMSQYLYWDKDPQSASSIHVAFATDETAFRFTYRCDGQPVLASAITPYQGSNTQSAFVSLGAASA